ncbi:hypothetical protein CC1G_05350 [Coprinopsis cinerea okayama7|uniref:G protein-coupled receptor n=1 Tax=Coprinopsis cinerea (strain Okayama-7 / 130 / ATCC MYA-4618 / FGSC 9003) TaxID=240176 RepID=A8NPS1_COPC7|nr:hypothetical protein CC1G_05350 [Coprinopsis cinerea okayama7\|eukprot:XP_001835388.2 hypothetical protein CC1G_05350 [Coprinopsis cinerea okayama7\
MALYGLSIFLETPLQQRKGRRRYIIISFILTFLAALSNSLDVAAYFHVLWDTTSPMEFVKLMALSQRESEWMHLASIVAIAGQLLIGDALLVYRCYVFFVGYRWIAILPGLTTIAGVVLFLIGSNIGGEGPRQIAAAAKALTVTTNLIVTILITFRILRTRRMIARLLPNIDTRVYTGVMAILIESALPLSVFGILAAIMRGLFQVKCDRLTEAHVISYTLFTGLFYSFCSHNRALIHQVPNRD